MITNKHNVSLPLASFLVHDEYDHVKEDNYISATQLLKPVKSVILSKRIVGTSMDVMDMVPSAVGTASHDRLEKSFLHNNFIINMRKLGYPEDVVQKVRINPVSVSSDIIPIYLEKRTIKKLGKWHVGGKFDFVMEGAVRDLKTTKVFSWIKNDFDDYIKQGSIYRWLNPDIITEDYMHIDFLFTDWKQYELDSKPEYPPAPAASKKFPLMSYIDTESWLKNRLATLERYWDAEQGVIPNCTQTELWQDDAKYAYFKNPGAKRATKVFDSLMDANNRLILDGNVGKVDTRLGVPKRCNYCAAKPDCNQAQEYVKQKLLDA